MQHHKALRGANVRSRRKRGAVHRAVVFDFDDALTADALTQLLERYLTGREEAAFAALVRRHGPMVLAVCRRKDHPIR